MRQFAEASRRLEDAQRRALEGEAEEAAEWRAAAARDREATAAVVELAEGVARDAASPVSARAVELVGETLRAAAGDPELRDRVVRGRVERERSAATLGTPAVGRPRRRDPAPAKRPDLANARRELKRLERDLAAAAAREERLRGQVEKTPEALRDNKRRLAESRRETADLRRRVNAAERRSRG